MSLEVIVNSERTAEVELLKKEGNLVSIRIDEAKYDIDIMMVENGVYSILLGNKSYNVELVRGDTNKSFVVNTLYDSFDIEIVDAQSKYMKSRGKGIEGHAENIIYSPMPGKIVKIPVAVGNEVKAGDTVIIVEAMKMQSEYKVRKDCKIKEINVSEGDTIEGNQTLIVLE